AVLPHTSVIGCQVKSPCNAASALLSASGNKIPVKTKLLCSNRFTAPPAAHSVVSHLVDVLTEKHHGPVAHSKDASAGMVTLEPPGAPGSRRAAAWAIK